MSAVALDELRTGGKRALAAALAGLEAAADAPETADLLDAAFARPRGFALGLTGPPGVGKSTLIDALIRNWRARGRTVGVIAVDPSSAHSGGALLGDRTRLTTDPADAGVFVRSMAARDRLGGVAGITFPAVVLMRALFDVVIVETVGVGQSETEIAGTADIVAFCAQPGSGDALQYMKAGITEVPDLVIVTKADMGATAARTIADINGALSLGAQGSQVPVLGCAAVSGAGVADVLHVICTRADDVSPRFAHTRAEQVRTWAECQIRNRFGTLGLSLVYTQLVDNSSGRPFRGILTCRKHLAAVMTAAFQ